MTDPILNADDARWKVTSPDGDLVVMGFEELDNEAAMRGGTLMAFSYQPTQLEGQPPEPRQYRRIRVERLARP